MEPWLAMVDVAQQVTGRRVVGTAGGLYKFTSTELCLPFGSVEGLVHDLCHFVVADDSERRQENLGLSQDWEHPGYDRMVKCEELAWSLETYLFGDPPPKVMRSLLTPEAQATGGGYYNYPPPKNLTVGEAADSLGLRIAESAIAEMDRARRTVIGHGELRPEGSEALRREACRKAEEMGLPVTKIQRIVRDWWLETYPPDPPEEDSLPAHWKDLKKRD